MSVTPGPFRFERRCFEKVWGGRALERRPGIALPADVPIGETWELVDRENENSVVAEGDGVGKTLAQVMREHAGDILGKAPALRGGRFPLLVKYIDACQNLSVQVHPDDETAAALGNGAQGKTEAWYVLDAAPEGVLYAGLRPEVSAEELAGIASTPQVVEALLRWEVRPGDCMLVPGGSVHAIGKGVTILEVQQNSDTTYRIWDWGRMGLDGKPRETHVPQALRSAAYGAPARPPIRPMWEPIGEDGALGQHARLARTRFFGMNSLRLRGEQRLSADGQFQIYAVIEGKGRLRTRRPEREHALSAGDVWLVPASCGYHWIAPDPDAPGPDQECKLTLVQLCHQA